MTYMHAKQAGRLIDLLCARTESSRSRHIEKVRTLASPNLGRQPRPPAPQLDSWEAGGLIYFDSQSSATALVGAN